MDTRAIWKMGFHWKITEICSWIGPIGPKRLNRAHWPTKESRPNTLFLLLAAYEETGFQISLIFQWKPIFQIALGPPTWARYGPTHVGPDWAHPFGPSLGPPMGAPIFLEALNGWLRCRRRFFFPEKWPPYFYKPWASGHVAAGAFFSEKWSPYFWGSLLELFAIAESETLKMSRGLFS